MLLAVDVGNTNILLGIFEGKNILSSWRLHTDSRLTTDEFTLFVDNLLQRENHNLSEIDALALACVVPPLLHPITSFAERRLKISPLIVGPGTKTGMPILLDNPKELGADLIVNAVAAKEKFGQPLIVIDFGTATTFSIVSDKGEYAGGLIAPGIRMATEGLFKETAKLPRVEIVEPTSVLGKSSITAIQSGVFYGFVGLVKEIILNIWREIDCKCLVVATGGLSGMITPHVPQINYREPLLTLEGLQIIYEKNQKR